MVQGLGVRARGFMCHLFYHCFHRGSCRWSRWWCSDGDGSSLDSRCRIVGFGV